jgi:hypothetical protein
MTRVLLHRKTPAPQQRFRRGLTVRCGPSSAVDRSHIIIATPIRAQPALGASCQPIDILAPELARRFNSTFFLYSAPCTVI